MHTPLGVFEGIPIEGLRGVIIEEKEATHFSYFSEKNLLRILQQACFKIKKNYGSNEDQYMVKDFKTQTKWMLFIRKDERETLFGYIYAFYDIDYCPYYKETSKFYKSSDSVKIIEKKLKKASENHVYFHYDYDDSFFKDMFEYGKFYKTYEIINLNKEKYR